MEQQQERLVKGIWIPIEIWKDKNLTWNEKILFLEIDSYTSKDKDCYFSNEYISDLLGINITNASKTISSLIEKGYIIKTKFDGRKRYVKTALSYSTTLPCREEQPSHARTIEYTSLHSNNNLINKDNKKEIEDKSSKKDDEIDDFIEKIYKLYPTKCPIRGTSLSKSHADKKRIKALLKKYTKEQILMVVENEIKNKYGKYSLKNFSTFLNNFPDPSEMCENSTPKQNTLFDNLPTGMIIRETQEERNEKFKNEKGW